MRNAQCLLSRFLSHNPCVILHIKLTPSVALRIDPLFFGRRSIGRPSERPKREGIARHSSERRKNGRTSTMDGAWPVELRSTITPKLGYCPQKAYGGQPMLNLDKLMNIKDLHKQGYSIKGIVRQTGHARNTVRSVLRGMRNALATSRKQRRSKLDPFKDYLKQQYQETEIPVPRLFSNICELGYKGSIAQVYRCQIAFFLTLFVAFSFDPL